MSRHHKTRRYREATPEENCKIHFIGFQLGELFDEDELHDLLAIARQRIIGEFFHARDIYRGRKLRTDNYIIGVEGRVSSLGRYVVKNTHRRIVRPSDLPSDLQDLEPKRLDRIISRANYDLVVLELQEMLNFCIWYDEALGIWQATQSAIDEYTQYRRTATRVKNDVRAFHGRVRSQSEARCVPPGTSIGIA